jgi:hypothetical protein
MTAHLQTTFGIEIECMLPEDADRHQLARAITRRLRGLNDCRVESYNHGLRTWWKIVTDGSLGDTTRGVEIVAPPLDAAGNGFEQLERVIGAASDFGCTVSRKCGLHVHVGVGRSQPIEFFRNLFKLYATYEPAIDAFMPPSRRASTNMYCRSMTTVSFTAIDRASDLTAILDLTTRVANERRYHKLNLAAVGRHGTVEFRQHSGTLEFPKTKYWTLFCLRMVARAKVGALPIAQRSTSAPLNRARRNSKAYLVGEMLLRPEGVTRAEVMAATGWPSVSLPQQAEACGLSFTTQRTGREVRYFAAAAQASIAPSATDTTLDGMIATLALDADEAAYFRRRTSDLSGSDTWRV